MPAVDDRVPDRLLLLRRVECPLPGDLWVTAATFGVGLVLLLMAVIFAMIELRAALDPVELEEDFVTLMSEEVLAVREGSDGGQPP